MIYLLHNVTGGQCSSTRAQYHIIPDLLQMKKEGKDPVLRLLPAMQARICSAHS